MAKNNKMNMEMVMAEIIAKETENGYSITLAGLNRLMNLSKNNSEIEIATKKDKKSGDVKQVKIVIGSDEQIIDIKKQVHQVVDKTEKVWGERGSGVKINIVKKTQTYEVWQKNEAGKWKRIDKSQDFEAMKKVAKKLVKEAKTA